MKEVAVGILIRDGSILACQRLGTVRFPLKWEFPGGKLEENETPPEALARELREELGIDAVIGREFHRQEWTYTESGSSATFRVFYYLVHTFAEPLTNITFEEIRWVSPQELEELDLLDGNVEVVALLNRNAIPTQ